MCLYDYLLVKSDILRMTRRNLSVDEIRELLRLRDLADDDSDGGEELDFDDLDDFLPLLTDEDEIELVDDDDEIGEPPEQATQNVQDNRDQNAHQQQADPSNIDQTSKAGKRFLFSPPFILSCS